MNARFFEGEKIASADSDGIKREPALMIELTGGFLGTGKDAVIRPATDDDKLVTYKDEYAAFLEAK